MGETQGLWWAPALFDMQRITSEEKRFDKENSQDIHSSDQGSSLFQGAM